MYKDILFFERNYGFKSINKIKLPNNFKYYDRYLQLINEKELEMRDEIIKYIQSNIKNDKKMIEMCLNFYDNL